MGVGNGGAAGADAGGGAVNGGVPGISCQGSGEGLHDCGPDSVSCCTRPLVVGGTFYLDYDGVLHTDQSHSATVGDFRLDKYEVTIGRFRRFIAAWDAGWRPAAGAGRHTQLNGGNGLANSAPAGGYENGWRTEWSSRLPTTLQAWYYQLGGGGPWTPDDSYDARHPVQRVDWYDAYAFCIWDGGFLPSEAEWNYAAAGGDEQRVYPWSSPPASTVVDCSRAVYLPAVGSPCGATAPSAPAADFVGSDSPRGDGKWGHSDLSGNVDEWVLDGYWMLPHSCVNCAYGVPDDVYPSPKAIVRGGAYTGDAVSLVVSNRGPADPDVGGPEVGVRCAYSP